jgi:hypothetical protein
MGNQQKQVDSHEKTLQALELRKTGMTYSDIARVLGYADGTGAFQAVRRALQATMKEPAEELRTMEEARIDAALAAIWNAVLNGSYGAIDRFIRLSERRSRLRGLDAPVQVGLQGGLENSSTEYIDIFVHDPQADAKAKREAKAKAAKAKAKAATKVEAAGTKKKRGQAAKSQAEGPAA